MLHGAILSHPVPKAIERGTFEGMAVAMATGYLLLFAHTRPFAVAANLCVTGEEYVVVFGGEDCGTESERRYHKAVQGYHIGRYFLFCVVAGRSRTWRVVAKRLRSMDCQDEDE
jgi:hypothetical protein